MRKPIAGAGIFSLAASLAWAAPLPPPSAPVIAQAYGFVHVPGVAIMPDKHRIYRAIFSATEAADTPDGLLPAVRMAGTELNTLVASGVPLSHADYVIDFHGPGAMTGLLDNAHYRRKFGIDNPNLPVLAELKKSGVRLYVCSQQMLAMGLAFDSISPDVTLASDGLFVLINFQNQGYAYLPF